MAHWGSPPGSYFFASVKTPEKKKKKRLVQQRDPYSPVSERPCMNPTKHISGPQVVEGCGFAFSA